MPLSLLVLQKEVENVKFESPSKAQKCNSIILQILGSRLWDILKIIFSLTSNRFCLLNVICHLKKKSTFFVLWWICQIPVITVFSGTSISSWWGKSVNLSNLFRWYSSRSCNKAKVLQVDFLQPPHSAHLRQAMNIFTCLYLIFRQVVFWVDFASSVKRGGLGWFVTPLPHRQGTFKSLFFCVLDFHAWNPNIVYLPDLSE